MSVQDCSAECRFHCFCQLALIPFLPPRYFFFVGFTNLITKVRSRNETFDLKKRGSAKSIKQKNLYGDLRLNSSLNNDQRVETIVKLEVRNYNYSYNYDEILVAINYYHS